MGEAKRRKASDPGFGKSRPFFRIGSSQFTGKFLVELHHRREKKVISPHYAIEDARHGIEMCQKCLDTFSNEEVSGHIDTWFRSFIRRLVDDFKYDDDDEILAVGRSVNGSFVIDQRRSVINEATALANIQSIQRTGKKLFT